MDFPQPRDVSWYGTPQSHDARCDLCPLKGTRHVPYSPPTKKIRLALVGEGPGRRELAQRTPFVGQTGQILNEQLSQVGLDRGEAWVTNGAMCLGETDEDNERAAECCAPRLLRELAALPPEVPIILFGKAATRAVLGVKSILLARGFVWTARDLTDAIAGAEAGLRKLERGKKSERNAKKVADAKLKIQTLKARNLLAGRTVLPTLHPTFAFFHSETWAPIFTVDLDRAARWVRGELTSDMLADKIVRVKSISALKKTKRSFVVTDNVKEIDEVSKILGPEVACDIETERLKPLSPMLARILTVQISDGVRGIVIAPWDARIHAEVVTRFLKGRTVIFHNGFCFDSIAMQRDGVSFDEVKLEDTLSAHHSFASQYPQKLDHVVATFIDSSPWKIRFGVRGAGEKGEAPVHSDEEDLAEYGACLIAGSRVVLADGSARSIETIVHERQRVQVLSMAANGTLVARGVIGWHQKRVPAQCWISIRVAGSGQIAKRRNKTIRGIVATPEHRIYTARGWRRADSIRVGDLIAQPERALSTSERGALLGTLLGDSIISVAPTRRGRFASAETAAVAGTHTDRSGLAQHKRKATRGFVTNAVSASARYNSPNAQPSRAYSTPMSAQIASLIPLVYDKQRRRRIRVDTLNLLGPAGLAWWFMDDGCLQKGGLCAKNTGARGGRKRRKDIILINTQGFLHKDVLAAATWLKAKFGHAGLRRDKRTPHPFGYVIYLGVDASVAFCNHIAPHVPPRFRYKFPRGETWSAYDPAPLCSEDTPFYAPVTAVGPFEPKRDDGFQRHVAETRYCLTVEDTHNFFTSYGLVANCDAFVTKLAWDAMQKDLDPERKVYEHDKRRALLYKSLQVVGYPVDRRRRRLLAKKLKLRASALKGRMRHIARRPNFAPSKLNDVRHVLFKVLKAPMLNPTPSGLAGTSNATLEALRADEGSRVARFSTTLLNWRATLKSLNTYIEPVPVYADGRAHYNFKPFGVITGRPASRILSAPRWSKALPERVREIYRAEPGRTLVYFDLAQAEARFAANLSDDANFIAAVAKDIHTRNALLLFPDAREALEKDPKGKYCPRHSEKGSANAACTCGKPFRDVTKNAGFAILYQAHPSKVLAYLRSQGFPVELGQVEDMYAAMRDKYQDYDRYVKDNVRFVEVNGFLRTALVQRIIWLGFHPKPTDVSNLPIQSGIADVIDTRLLDNIIPNLPKGSVSVPGPKMILHHYDSATFDTANEEVEEVRALLDATWKVPVRLEESIVCRKACEFMLPAETKVGRRWSEL